MLQVIVGTLERAQQFKDPCDDNTPGVSTGGCEDKNGPQTNNVEM